MNLYVAKFLHTFMTVLQLVQCELGVFSGVECVERLWRVLSMFGGVERGVEHVRRC